jgi:acyl-coenzyme A thioesterase PaaI-like protein
MLVSENLLKWAMRFYPPLFFQRIWVVQIDRDFMGAEVRIAKSFLNMNYNRSIFGGTIFCAADPFFGVLFYQVLKRKGLNVRIWLKSASINYLKPGFSKLCFKLKLNEQDIRDVENTLAAGEKFIRTFSVELWNKDGQLCATVNNEVYIKKI